MITTRLLRSPIHCLQVGLLMALVLLSASHLDADEDAGLESGGNPPPSARHVAKAVEIGARWIRRFQCKDGSFCVIEDPLAARSWGLRVGETALCALALSESGDRRARGAARKAIGFLRRAIPRTMVQDDLHESPIYSVSTWLLALEAFYRNPKSETVARSSRLPNWVRVAATQGAEWLLAARGNGGMWGYSAGSTADHVDVSLTQFAVEGLRAARRLGARMPSSALQLTLSRLCSLQKRVVSDGPAAGGTGGDVVKGEVGGWSYTAGGRHTRGGPTAAAALAVALCLELGPVEDPGGLRPSARRALEAATMWLNLKFEVEQEPVDPDDAHAPRGIVAPYCYLYLLAKVCNLLDLRQLGERSWREAGARHLLATQQEDGSWKATADDGVSGNLYATCFAVMFLSCVNLQ
jgi:hypothetical protein